MSSEKGLVDLDADFERVLLVKQSVYVYKIPPLMSMSRGFRAADWNLAQPDWTGRLRLISKGKECFLRIEDSSTGALYCQAPVLEFPGPQVQPVTDSRRYFVIKVVDSASGRSALIGIGFADGADSFDLSVALQDHFTTENKINDTPIDDSQRPKLDLSLKSDIRVNLNIAGLGKKNPDEARAKLSTSTNSCRDTNSSGAQPFRLPPPPSGARRARQ